MTGSNGADLVAPLQRLSLIDGPDAHIEPLAGGVSSDIYKVQSGSRVFVVKRALPKLKVAADWEAPVERNRHEVGWMEVAGHIVPGAAPRLLGHDPSTGLFAMEYLEPVAHPVWKAELREGRVDLAFSAEVGRRIATIHGATAGDGAIARRFATDHIFHPIRLEPYLEATARRHPTIARTLLALSQSTLAAKIALVHGDVSPKNILVGPNGPIFLDAECAWYGDPAFDLAFCLNHLLLKCLENRAGAARYLAAFQALAEAYLDVVTWEPADVLEARAARLLPALFLARVDGKSPVEYITHEGDRELVRGAATPLIERPAQRLAQIAATWAAQLSLPLE